MACFESLKRDNMANKNTTQKKATYTPSTDSDYLNPDYLFSTTWTELLSAIATGKIDANELAKKELANRGLNIEGTWVVFKQAAELLKK